MLVAIIRKYKVINFALDNVNRSIGDTTQAQFKVQPIESVELPLKEEEIEMNELNKDMKEGGEAQNTAQTQNAQKGPKETL